MAINLNLNPSTTPVLDLTARPISPSKPAGPSDFSALFEDAVFRVEQYQKQADDGNNRFLAGESEDIHTIALAGQRSELAFDLFLQSRNKIVQAYQEVMRMQL